MQEKQILNRIAKAEQRIVDLYRKIIGSNAPVTPTPTSSYKVYTALLTQTGTSNPIATVIENTLGGTIVWTRPVGAGNFWGTLSGISTTTNKTFLLASNSFPSNVKDLTFYRLNNNTFVLYNANSTGTLQDEMSVFIEIRIYN